MNSNPTREEVLASIVANSEQLNAEDLLTGEITVTVTGVRRGTKEQPIFIALEGYDLTFRACKTVRRVLIATFGDDPSKWIGQRMTLFTDPAVMYGGVKIGGIRISHLSGLKTPRSYMLAMSRGKRSEVTIHPIAEMPEQATPTDEEQEFIDDATKELAVATAEELAGHGKILKGKSEAIRKALRPVYEQRQKELKG